MIEELNAAAQAAELEKIEKIKLTREEFKNHKPSLF